MTDLARADLFDEHLSGIDGTHAPLDFNFPLAGRLQVVVKQYQRLFEMEDENSSDHIAYALSDVPFVGYNFFHKNFYKHVSDFGEGFDYNFGTKTSGTLWKVAMGAINIQGGGAVVGGMRKDYGRIHQALLSLNEHCHWGMADFFEELQIRISYGVPERLVGLVKIEGIGKNFAKNLESMGIMSQDDILCNSDFILGNLEGPLAKIVQRIVDDAK